MRNTCTVVHSKTAMRLNLEIATSLDDVRCALICFSLLFWFVQVGSLEKVKNHHPGQPLILKVRFL